MRFPLSLAVGVLLTADAALAAPQAPVRTSVQVTAVAAVEERTALRVSAHVLTFVVPPGGSPATASLDFTAGVRTEPGRDVLLVARAPGAPDLALVFTSGAGPQEGGRLAAGEPVVLARWSGGGRRTGRIVFTLEDAAPGLYTVPIQLTISVP